MLLLLLGLQLTALEAGAVEAPCNYVEWVDNPDGSLSKYTLEWYPAGGDCCAPASGNAIATRQTWGACTPCSPPTVQTAYTTIANAQSIVGCVPPLQT